MDEFQAGGVWAGSVDLRSRFFQIAEDEAALRELQIPSNLIAPQAKTLLAYLPAPTNLSSLGLPNTAPNYIAPVPNKTTVNGVAFCP